METNISLMFDVIGIIIAIAFVIMMFRGMRSLQGSFFKDYYRAMAIAAIALLFGFAIEPLNIYLLHFTEFLGDQLHHLGLIVASMLFVYAGYLLPKDAAQYMKSDQGKI